MDAKWEAAWETGRSGGGNSGGWSFGEGVCVCVMGSEAEVEAEEWRQEDVG